VNQTLCIQRVGQAAIMEGVHGEIADVEIAERCLNDALGHRVRRSVVAEQ
jgi:hypothetical protein